MNKVTAARPEIETPTRNKIMRLSYTAPIHFSRIIMHGDRAHIYTFRVRIEIPIKQVMALSY